jgi:hypothetical protein
LSRPPGGPENSRLLVSKRDSVDRSDWCFRNHVSKAVSKTGFKKAFQNSIPIADPTSWFKSTISEPISTE